MGKELGKYDRELAERLESIRKRQRLTQDEMAFFMGVDVGQYKRYIYLTCRVPAERIASLVDNLDLDPTYVLTGRLSSTYDCIKIIETATDGEMADLLISLSKVFRERERIKSRKEVDYILEKDKTVVENNKKKAD